MANSYTKEQSAFKPPKKEVEKKKPKPIAKRSKKRMQKDAEYTTLRFMFLTKNNKCQICKVATSQQVHHKHSGKDRDKHYLDVPTWMALCVQCHIDVHAEPAEARQKGFLF